MVDLHPRSPQPISTPPEVESIDIEIGHSEADSAPLLEHHQHEHQTPPPNAPDAARELPPESGPSQASSSSAPVTSSPPSSSAAAAQPSSSSSSSQPSSEQQPTASTFSQRAYNFFSRKWWRSSGADGEEEEEGNAASSSSSSTGRRTRPLDIEAGGSSDEIHQSSPSSRPGSSSSSNPVCLICLETLAPEDFASGRAISLGCQCRGDLALRHKDCAQKWATVKDNGQGGVPVCELCKHPAKNLPPIPPRPHLLRPDHAASAAAAHMPGGTAGVQTSEELYLNEQMALSAFAPSTADMVFDCIRVTWVAMIVSILFFEATLGSALFTGIVAGFAYAVMVRLMYRHHFEAMRAYAEQQAGVATVAVVTERHVGGGGGGGRASQVAINIV